MNYKLLYFLFNIFVSISLFGQMTQGDYPYQKIDSLHFKNSEPLFQIDLSTKPNNFVSTKEEIYDIIINTYMEKAESIENQKNELNRKLTNRNFIAGISNNSKDTINIPIQDNSVIAVLEAKNDNNKWKPIQFWPISGCGNSYLYERLNPGQTLLIAIKSDLGTIPTEMRIRFHGEDTILISESFNGTIEKEMFQVINDLKLSYHHILCDSISYLEKPYKGKFRPFKEIEIIEFEE